MTNERRKIAFLSKTQHMGLSGTGVYIYNADFPSNHVPILDPG